MEVNSALNSSVLDDSHHPYDNAERLRKIIVSPAYTFGIIAPFVLPDFYIWKVDFDPDRHSFLIYLWILGVILKYVSLLLSLVACYASRKNLQWKIIVPYILFFVVIAFSALAHGLGTSSVEDVWNQLLLGLPAILYFPSVITKRSKIESDKRLIKCIFYSGMTVACITIVLYVIYPHGFAEAFGIKVSPKITGDRSVGIFIGGNTDTPLYGVMLLASVILISMINGTTKGIWLTLPVTVTLLYFSTSVTAKAISLILLVMFLFCLLLNKRHGLINFLRTITTPFFVYVAFSILSFLLTAMAQQNWFSQFMIFLHRDPTMTGRVNLYKIAIGIFTANPIAGIGFNANYYWSIMINDFGQHVPFPHNSYLQILMESGLIGFSLFTVFIFSLIKREEYIPKSKETMLNVLFLCSVISASFSGDFFAARFYLILSLLYCSKIIGKKVQNQEKPVSTEDFSKNQSKTPAKKNVLLFMTKLDVGGIEKMYQSIIPKLTNRYNFIITCYGAGDNQLEQEFSNLGCTILKLEVNRYRHPIQFIDSIRNIIKIHDVSIFHSNVGYSTFFGLFAAWLSKVPIRIAHSHNGKFGIQHNPMNPVFSALCKLSCHYLATARINIGGTSARALFFNSDESIFLPNGIDLKQFAFNEVERKKGRELLCIPEDTSVLLHIGRFTPQKNHSFLIKTFKQYHDSHQNSRLILAGGGELLSEIHKQIKDLNLTDAVVFLGIVPTTANLYSIADALVFPSLYEGLPVTLVEAQANGVPVFASDRIDRAIDLSDKITFLPLSDSPSQWAQILPTAPANRKIVQFSSKLEQFDCSQTAETLAKVYRGELK